MAIHASMHVTYQYCFNCPMSTHDATGTTKLIKARIESRCEAAYYSSNVHFRPYYIFFLNKKLYLK